MSAWMRAVRGGVALGVVGALALPAAAQDAVGVGGMVFIDDGQLEDTERRSILEDRESFPFGSDGLLGASVWWLRELDQRFRAGARVSWFGSYALVEDVDDDEDEPDPIEYGHLLEVAGRGELVAGMTDAVDLVLGGELGLLFLFPGGDLEAEIEALDNQGVDVWSGPKLGWSAKATAGARWRYSDRLAVRGDLGLGYNALWIFDTDETVQGIRFQKQRDLEIWRYSLTLGVEVSL